jgi:YbbR domain-containing protein
VRLEKLYRALTANIALKIISLVFAIVLWLYVTSQIGEKQSFRIPLELSNIPDSLTLVREVPKYVEVTMQGTRSDLLRLRLSKKVRAIVDLSSAHRGKVVVPLASDVVAVPPQFRTEDVIIRSPRSLTLDFEPLLSRYVPVEAVLEGTLPKDLILVGRPIITPDQVLVRGAANVMAALTAVRTEPINLANKREGFSREVSLEPGVPGLQLIPSEVLVEIDVSKRAIRTIEGVTPTVLHPGEGVGVDYSPKTASVTVEGPESIVRRLVPDDISIILTIASGKTGTYRVEPEVIVPQGIDAYSLDVDSFEVRVFPKR